MISNIPVRDANDTRMSETTAASVSRESVERVDRRSRVAENILVLLIIVVMTLVGVFLRWEDQVARYSQYPYLIADPDSALALHLLERSIAEDHWHQSQVTWDNAPHGRINEWSAANVLLLRAAYQFFQGDRAGQAVFLEAVPPLIGAVMTAVPGLLALRFGRRRMAFFWVIGTALLPGMVAPQLSGFVDYHGLQVAAWTMALAAFVLFLLEARSWLGYIAGAAQGLLLVLGPMEHLPILTLTAALAISDGASRKSPPVYAEFWRRWVCSGFAVVFCFAAIARFPAERLEVLGLWHVLLWAVLALVILLLKSPRFPALDRRWVLGRGAAALSLVVAAFVIVRSPEPLVIMLEPGFAAHARVIQELHRYPGSTAAVGWRLLLDGGLLWFAPLLLFMAVRKRYRADAGRRWTWFLAGLIVLSLLYLLLMSRGARTAAPILAIVPPLLLQRVSISSRWRVTLFAVAIALPAWSITLWAQSGGTYVVPALHRMREYHRAAESLADDLPDRFPPPVILVPVDGAPYFLLEEAARTVGSLYWSNLAGLQDAVTLLTTTNEVEFRRLSSGRQVEFILLPPVAMRGAMYSAALTYLHENPRDRRIADHAILRQLERREYQLRVRTPALNRDAPGWVLLRNPHYEAP